MIIAKDIPQNWITAYTHEDVDYVLRWHTIIPDETICKDLNITELTLKEIIMVNEQSKTTK